MTSAVADDLLLIHDIPVEVRRNKRRRTRMGMTIDPGGFLVLDVPLNASLDDVEIVIGEHKRWLRHRLAQLEKEAPATTRLSYRSGELAHYLGDALTLQVQQGLFELVLLHDKQLVVTTPSTDAANVRELLTNWYTERATQVLHDVLAQYAWLPWLDGNLPRWRHRYMRSQWGSCSAQGRLSLNTHLVKTPQHLIEYVVLHELCHLRYHHHGPEFHELVEHYMPDWRERARQLDKHLPLLLQE